MNTVDRYPHWFATAVVFMLALTQIQISQGGETDHILFELGIDGDRSRDKVKGQGSDSNSGSDAGVFLQGLIDLEGSLDDWTLLPSLEISEADKPILDREDELRLVVGLFTTPSGERYYPLVPEKGLTWGGEIWREDRKIGGLSDDRTGLLLSSLYYLEITKKLGYLIEFGGERISADIDVEQGKRVFVRGALFNSPKPKQTFQWTFPRVSLEWFDIDDSRFENEFLVSLQGSARWIHEFGRHWAVYGQVVFGVDKVDNFQGGEDFTSTYVRPGVYISYNPLRSGFGGALGGSSGGRWRRP